ncbi:hypothetical protein [Gimesia aquarii]|uniref:Cytochrome C Planctomycete-type domain-containing protein n=1 Tax=Gimesia aquarii TaxID=2527964 RepID=A0A517VQR7_9PLAN|nr:hypothetical protein [Gimesia aquarii]QDT95366.1 hypothetical protein V144x_08080 [Gimesia aquarii]
MSVLEAHWVRSVFAVLIWGGFGVFPCVGFAESQTDKTLATQKEDAQQFFSKQVKPFIKKYCIDCHQNRRSTEAGLSFDPALRTYSNNVSGTFI